LTMGDEDDCFSPYKCVRLFPSENEWPWSLSEEDVPVGAHRCQCKQIWIS
jgi:hypothetical protein